MILKHAIADTLSDRRPARVAVTYRGGEDEWADPHYHQLVVEPLARQPAPRAALLLHLLDAVLGSDWRERAETLHRSRRSPWRVERRVGMSGCRDYRLRVQKRADIRDEPIVAVLHVSSGGKLNEGLSLWLGDLPPLLAAAIEDGVICTRPPFVSDRRWAIASADECQEHRVTVFDPPEREFQSPGSGSGFLELEPEREGGSSVDDASRDEPAPGLLTDLEELFS